MAFQDLLNEIIPLDQQNSALGHLYSHRSLEIHKNYVAGLPANQHPNEEDLMKLIQADPQIVALHAQSETVLAQLATLSDQALAALVAPAPPPTT